MMYKSQKLVNLNPHKLTLSINGGAIKKEKRKKTMWFKRRPATGSSRTLKIPSESINLVIFNFHLPSIALKFTATTPVLAAKDKLLFLNWILPVFFLKRNDLTCFVKWQSSDFYSKNTNLMNYLNDQSLHEVVADVF